MKFALGQPVENVVRQMQGGGVCIADPEQTGIISNDPMASPFVDWTKAYLPYCTPDVFAGGGTISNFPHVTVRRRPQCTRGAALRARRAVARARCDHRRRLLPGQAVEEGTLVTDYSGVNPFPCTID